MGTGGGFRREMGTQKARVRARIVVNDVSGQAIKETSGYQWWHGELNSCEGGLELASAGRKNIPSLYEQRKVNLTLKPNYKGGSRNEMDRSFSHFGVYFYVLHSCRTAVPCGGNQDP